MYICNNFLRLPWLSLRKASRWHPILCHCEERSDEAILKRLPRPPSAGSQWQTFGSFFCPCEPERHRRSSVAIYFFLNDRFRAPSFLKRRDCHGFPKGKPRNDRLSGPFFCPCEPERHRRSGVAIYFFIENYSGNFLFLKNEIATPAFGGLAMTKARGQWEGRNFNFSL